MNYRIFSTILNALYPAPSSSFSTQSEANGRDSEIENTRLIYFVKVLEYFPLGVARTADSFTIELLYYIKENR